MDFKKSGPRKGRGWVNKITKAGCQVRIFQLDLFWKNYCGTDVVEAQKKPIVALIANWFWMEQIVDFKIYVVPPQVFLFLKTKEKSAFIETIYGFWQRWSFFVFCFFKKGTQPYWKSSPPHPLPTRVRGPAGASIRNADVYHWREGGCQVQEMGCRGLKGMNFRRGRKERKRLRSKLMSVRFSFLLLREHKV